MSALTPPSGLFQRSPANPLLTAADWPYPVNTVFNPGATVVGDETVLLVRVEDRRGISHLTVARSRDGVTGWRVEREPLLADDPDDHTSMWGVEDARITRVDELDGWVILYTAYGPQGPCVAMAVTQDFRTVKRFGVVMTPEDKNASMLPRRVDGQWILFHRPASRISGRSDVWLSRSADMSSWSAPEPVFGARSGAWWDAVRVGIGPAPIETEHGWLGIYHGVKETVSGVIYRVGLVLLDRDNPARVIRRCDEWVLGPAEDYELVGDVGNVVFPTGVVHIEATNELRVYYGAADTSIGMAAADLDEVMAYVLACPEPREGHLRG